MPSNQRETAPVAAALQETDDATAQLRHELIEAGRVMDDVGAVEDGHSTAASATSPQLPQPTQLLSIAATGSSFSGSLVCFTESEGQPERRMQA